MEYILLIAIIGLAYLGLKVLRKNQEIKRKDKQIEQLERSVQLAEESWTPPYSVGRGISEQTSY